MAEPDSEGGCCRCCCSFIITSGLTALFFWLSLRTSSPICSIERFDAFALNKTAISTTKTTNNTLQYDLKLKNGNKDMGIYYDALNLTFYYKPNLTTFFVGNATHPAFYQGHGKSTHRIWSFQATLPGVNWKIAANESAVFRAELATAIRYKIIFWKTKRRHLVVAADLHVNDQGILVKRKKNKGIKLSSGAPKIMVRCFHWMGILGTLAILHFW